MNQIKENKIYYNDSLSSVPSSGTAIKIVNGRSALHSVIVSFLGPSSSGLAETRAYNLCGSDDINDVLFKFVLISTMNHRYASSASYFNTGGNGILFENGIYLSKDATSPSGNTPVVDAILSLSVIYTGGDNA